MSVIEITYHGHACFGIVVDTLEPPLKDNGGPPP